MNITLLDADTREVIRVVDCPKSPDYVADEKGVESKQKYKQFPAPEKCLHSA